MQSDIVTWKIILARKPAPLEKAEEMLYRTKAEYLQFLEGVKDKPMSYMAFQILYWTGIRIGELLALSFNDIDFENRKISITKTYTRIEVE